MSDNIPLSAIELAILEKHGWCLWNFDSIMSTSWDKCISGLAAAILDFQLPLTLDNIFLSAIELAILENMVGAFGISILSCLHAEIGYMHFRFNGGHLGFPISVYVRQYWD